MSYSFFNKCWDCKKGGEEYKSECVDKIIIQDAINIIHHLGNERHHLGAGSITLDCQCFDKKDQQ